MKYKCIKAFMVDAYDGDGFYADRYMEIKAGEIYEVENKKIINGQIHLDGINVNKWIEIPVKMLEKHFVEVEV